MFAVFQSGGKQYKVATNDVVKLEKLEGEPGSEVELNEVLLIGDAGKALIVGSPLVAGAIVTVEILSQARDKKVIVFKKERRQHYRRKNGHRQHVTLVRIKDIRKAA
jgi:large subunit ribosomal protein L21